MREQSSHVTVNEQVPSVRFRRFVEDEVTTWMQHEGVAELPAEYEVAFFDEDHTGEISCLVVIHCGADIWRSWESADNPRMALQRSLEHLKIEIQGEPSQSSINTTTPLPIHSSVGSLTL